MQATDSSPIKALTRATRDALAPLHPDTDDLVLIELDDKLARFKLKFVDARDYRPVPRLSASALDLLERLPERSNRRGNVDLGPATWLAAATDYTATVIASSWPQNQIRLIDEAGTVYTYLLNTLVGHTRIAEIYAKYKHDGTVPAHSLELHPDFPLTNYQQTATHCATLAEAYALFMEQGTGKTACVIAAVCNMLQQRARMDQPFRVAIVCPSNVRMNWVAEFAKFSTRIGQTTVLRGTALNRMDQLLDAMRTDPDDEFTAVIMSYDVLCESWRGLNLVEWDLAVLDEMHYIKTPGTRRQKYAFKLRDRARRRMGLTGTPITNTPLDLWTQLEFLYPGGSGFNAWRNFRSFYGQFDRGANGFEKLIGLKNLPMIQERLARFSYVIRKTEALPDLPAKVYDIEEVSMTKRQREVYKEIAENLAVEIEAKMGDEGQPRQLIVQNVLTMMLRLAQITSGFVAWDAIVNPDTGEEIEPQKIEHFKPSPKVEWLVEAMKSREPLSKTIVWACWKADINAIAERLRAEGFGCVTYFGDTSEADRMEAERAFNHDRDCTVFIGSQAAGGTGLNLLGYPPGRDDVPTDCDWVVYFSQNWSPTQRSQSEDRAHRRGTRKPVRITDLCVPRTIDEEIRARVLEKITTALEVSDVRKILRTVLTGAFDEDW